MGATLIVDDQELAPVLSGARTSEGWRAGLGNHEICRHDFHGESRVPHVVAQWLSTIQQLHYIAEVLYARSHKSYLRNLNEA